MPEFTVKEVRLPELRLPQIKRDEIARALSGVHIPEVDLTRLERRRRLPRLDLVALPWRKRGLSGVDLGRIIAAAITVARLVRPTAPPARRPSVHLPSMRRSRRDIVAVIRPTPRRSRRGFAVVAIAVAVAAAAGAAVWMLIRNPSIRYRVDGLANDARQRIAAMRARQEDADDLDTGEPESVAGTSIEAPADQETVLAQEALTAEAATEMEQPTNLA